MKSRACKKANEIIVAFVAFTGTVLLAANGYAQSPEKSAFVEERTEAYATVTDIDAQTRMISLKTESGDEVTVEAGPEVRNFAQIHKGDRVSVVYYQSMAAELTEAPAGSEPTVVGTAKRAAPGEKPSGRAGVLVTAIVTINAVDPETHMVKFTGADGEPREVMAMRPEMQDFVSRLKPGDRVKVTYGESLAVAVHPTTEDETEEAE